MIVPFKTGHKAAKRILLHIGLPKTGTTALQQFFVDNREAFAENGLSYYEPLHSYMPWKTSSNAGFLITYVFERIGKELSEDHRSNLKEEIPAFLTCFNNCDTVLLSEEWISKTAVYYPSFWKELAAGLSELCGKRVRVDLIFYLRRQDEWALTRWKEDLRARRPVGKTFRESLALYIKNGILDYKLQTDRIEEAFGRKHLSVRPYDRKRYEGGDIFHDFLAACGLPFEPSYTLPDEQVNESVNTATAEALRILNAREVEHTATPKQLYIAAPKFSRLHPEARGEHMLSRAEREELISRYAAGNRAIADRYCGGVPLFSDKVKDEPVFLPDPEIDRENARELALLAK